MLDLAYGSKLDYGWGYWIHRLWNKLGTWELNLDGNVYWLIILTFNGECNQWWLGKHLTKFFNQIGHVVSVFFFVGSRMTFQYKECTSNNNYYTLILHVANWVWNCWMNVCLGITAKVQSLQKMLEVNFKYKTFTTWDLMQNRLVNDIKSGNVQCMKFRGLH
jgi:hypothetical protein